MQEYDARSLSTTSEYPDDPLDRYRCRAQFFILRRLCLDVIEPVKKARQGGYRTREVREEAQDSADRLQPVLDAQLELVEEINAYLPREIQQEWPDILTKLAEQRSGFLRWLSPVYPRDDARWDSAGRQDWEELTIALGASSVSPASSPPPTRDDSPASGSTIYGSPYRPRVPSIASTTTTTRVYPLGPRGPRSDDGASMRGRRLPTPSISEAHSDVPSIPPSDSSYWQPGRSPPERQYPDTLSPNYPNIIGQSTSTSTMGPLSPSHSSSGYFTPSPTGSDHSTSWPEREGIPPRSRSPPQSPSRLSIQVPSPTTTATMSPDITTPPPTTTSYPAISPMGGPLGRMQSRKAPSIRSVSTTYTASHGDSGYASARPGRKITKNLALLTKRMRDVSQVDPSWSGVAEMVQLGRFTDTQEFLLKIFYEVMKREWEFIQDNTGGMILERLRSSDDVIPSERLDDFTQMVFGPHVAVREAHKQFLKEIPHKPDDLVLGGTMARLFNDHAQRLRPIYDEQGEALWQAQRYIIEESEDNPKFRQFAQEPLPKRGISSQAALKEFFTKPLEQIKTYPKVLELSLKEAIRSKQELHQKPLRDAISNTNKLVLDVKLLAWQTTLGKDESFKLTWNDLASDFDLRKIGDTEVKRQTAIFDFIEGEMNWVRLLGLFHTLFVKPLQSANPPVLSPEKMSLFLDRVYAMMKTLYDRHYDFLKRLLAVQREERPIIQAFVAPTALTEFPWLQTYRDIYASQATEAHEWIKNEMNENPTFESFLNNATFHSESTGQSILEQLQGPVVYLSKCSARLRLIIDYTPESHDDILWLGVVLDKVNGALKHCQGIFGNTIDRTQLSALAPLITWQRPGAEMDVGLDHSSRALLYRSTAWMPVGPDQQLNSFNIILLDNYLLVAEAVQKQDSTHFEVCTKPVPLELLDQTSESTQASRPYRAPGTGSILSPVAFRRRDSDSEVIFLVESSQFARHWKERMRLAISRRRNHVDERQLLFLLKQIHQFFRDATCSVQVPVNIPTTLVACAAPESGIWVVRHTDAPRMALKIDRVVQMGVMSGVLIVLSEHRVSAFKLDDVLGGVKNPHSQSINESDINFFRIYKMSVLVLRKKQREFLFYRACPSTGAGRSRAMMRVISKPNLVEKYDSFEFPNPCNDILFLKNRMVLLAENGFYFTDAGLSNTEDLKLRKGVHTTLLPSNSDPRRELMSKSRSMRPLALVKSHDDPQADFLLCYNQQGVFLDYTGKLTGRTVGWLSDSVSRIVTIPPHVLVFSSRLIEVRLAATGVLLQTIPTPEKMHMTWDGRDSCKDATGAVYGVHVVSNAQWDGNGGEVLQLLSRHV